MVGERERKGTEWNGTDLLHSMHEHITKLHIPLLLLALTERSQKGKDKMLCFSWQACTVLYCT
jgi:hypothetical protein